MDNVKVIGIRCGRPFDDIVRHFTGLGGDAILMDHNFVCGRDHVLSAVMHAERAFNSGTNRSKTLLTEIIMYAAGERQISKALSKMRPKEGCGEMVAAVLNVTDLRLEAIGAEEDECILACTPSKAKNMGLDNSMVPPGEMALEMVAMMDIQKQ